MRHMLALSAALVLCIAIAGPVSAGDEHADACCMKARAADAWCDGCKTGFFGGEKISVQKLHQALAGEKVGVETLKCSGCRDALVKNGSCDACHVMFAHGRMYRSPVAYRLALGDVAEAEKIACADCKKAAEAGRGWCDHCKAGIVGNRVFKEKGAYEDAMKAHEVLVAATKATCESCAAAMVLNGSCETCKASYKDGKKV